MPEERKGTKKVDGGILKLFFGWRDEASRENYDAKKKRGIINGAEPQSGEMSWYCNKDTPYYETGDK